MDFVNHVVRYIQALPPEVWQMIGAMLGVSALLQKLKNWLSLQSEKVITFLLGFLSFVPVVLDYINTQATQGPGVIAPRTLIIMGGATTMYRYVVKPVTNILKDASAERIRRQSQLTNDAEVNSVSIPPNTFDA